MTTAPLSDQITELGAKWYEYVSVGHHKDRDCHFYIEVDYAYGEPLVFSAIHCGYVGNCDIDVKCETYAQAEKELLKAMIKMVSDEGIWVNDVLSDPSKWDEDQIEQAKKFKELFGEQK